MKEKLIKIPFELIYTYLVSKKVVDHWLIICDIVKESNNNRILDLEGGCSCTFSLKEDSVSMPIDKNSITVSCFDCDKTMFRISGFLTKEWKLEVPECRLI